jgi:hypothetical protein
LSTVRAERAKVDRSLGEGSEKSLPILSGYHEQRLLRTSPVAPDISLRDKIGRAEVHDDGEHEEEGAQPETPSSTLANQM